jgi:response regulator RpfG family c-di-GMP phosphodiesterase
MEARAKPQVLCVDDEIRVAEGVALLLRKEFDVQVASSGANALEKLREMTELAVVISDMRMPNMDGAAFLHEVMLRRPDASRILLTGEAGVDGAIRAVNEGQIFRFLRKPCPFDQLKPAVDAAVIYHRMVVAERNVLKDTLLGCINALMEVLAIANPVAFGRAGQIKRRAMDLARRLGTPDFWQLEAAASLSQLGYAALPPVLVEKVYRGSALTPAEQAQVDTVPDMSNKLLEHIPRLEPVIQILAALKWSDTQMAALGGGTVGLGTRILSLILEYDTLTARGMTHDAICDHLCARTARFGPKLISQLDASLVASTDRETARELRLRDVSPGMLLQEEIRTGAGVLIVPRGFQVTQTFLERLGNMAPELLDTSVRVALPETSKSSRS